MDGVDKPTKPTRDFRSNRFDEVFVQGGVECIRKRLLTIHV